MSDALKARCSAAIRAARSRLGMSQEELAAKLDISLPALGNLERGINLPAFETLAAMVTVLDLDPRSLLLPPARVGRGPSRERIRIEAEINAALHAMSDREAAFMLEVAQGLSKLSRR
jgi:transcriptional regulator with XRE-family HTH domain